jgi:hypothetical protein
VSRAGFRAVLYEVARLPLCQAAVLRKETVAVHLTRIALLMLAVSLGGCSPDSATNLRDATASAVVQDYLNRYDVILVSLGPMEFRRGNWSAADFAPVEKYEMYKALASMGLIKLDDERDLSAGFTGWSDWLVLTQNGVQRTATVSLTAEGGRAGEVSAVRNSDRQIVSFRAGSYVIDDVVSNEEASGGVDRYRIVQASYRLSIKQGWRDVWIKAGKAEFPDGRVRIVLKYNPFDAKWQPTTIFDIGPMTGAFASENVPSGIASLRATGELPSQ